jgi:hypothetical protein
MYYSTKGGTERNETGREQRVSKSGSREGLRTKEKLHGCFDIVMLFSKYYIQKYKRSDYNKAYGDFKRLYSTFARKAHIHQLSYERIINDRRPRS